MIKIQKQYLGFQEVKMPNKDVGYYLDLIHKNRNNKNFYLSQDEVYYNFKNDSDSQLLINQVYNSYNRIHSTLRTDVYETLIKLLDRLILKATGENKGKIEKDLYWIKAFGEDKYLNQFSDNQKKELMLRYNKLNSYLKNSEVDKK